LVLQVDGIVVDIRQAPIELQELAFEQGYIPFIPSKQQWVLLTHLVFVWAFLHDYVLQCYIQVCIMD
jgi:hypothetical protein